MKTKILTTLFFVLSYMSSLHASNRLTLTLLPHEYWWAGISSLGHETPYDSTSNLSVNTWGDNKGNQCQPLLLSSKGRYVWSEQPICYEFKKGTLTVTVPQGKIVSGTSGNHLKTAFQYVSQKYFPSNGLIPDPLMFTRPQYNTWIELTYNQNEADILKYAENIIRNGYSPGVLMIDDNWQENYGIWEFSPRRFKDPKGMVNKLHQMGFKVMLWVCPFVSADSVEFRSLAKKGALILDPQKTQEILWADTKNKAAVIRWWNGASACVDLSNPKGASWFKQKLDYLVHEYGIDGFKFDAGDAPFYTNNVVSFHVETPNDHTALFSKIGLNYPFNEYRASWKMAGMPLVQRLRDKKHEWEDLKKLIPDLMSQSVMGYSYTCPDMIGGGEYQSFLNGSTIDEELVVRSAQVHALMPMMQFSVAPWRVLSKENAALCLKMSKLHEKFGDHIVDLARQSSMTGEPIVKPMEFAFPGNGYENIKDQFVLGNEIIVAPVVEKGVRSRKVFLPAGEWRDERGSLFKGGKAIEVESPLDRLPYFTQVRH